jgi:hypothetical protein
MLANLGQLDTRSTFRRLAYGAERVRFQQRRKREERFNLICSEIPGVEWTEAVSHAFARIKTTG